MLTMAGQQVSLSPSVGFVRAHNDEMREFLPKQTPEESLEAIHIRASSDFRLLKFAFLLFTSPANIGRIG